MPKFAGDLVKYVQTFLERTYERCRTSYMEVSMFIFSLSNMMPVFTLNFSFTFIFLFIVLAVYKCYLSIQDSIEMVNATLDFYGSGICTVFMSTFLANRQFKV